MRLKIGRHTYTITEDDKFLDNGACVQLLTQSKEKGEWGRKPIPKLSKRAAKEISEYERVQVYHDYDSDFVTVFKLRGVK